MLSLLAPPPSPLLPLPSPLLPLPSLSAPSPLPSAPSLPPLTLHRAGGTGPADPATAGPIFLAYLITIQIEEVTSVYKDDIDASELSKQLEIFGSSFSINEQKWVGN